MGSLLAPSVSRHAVSPYPLLARMASAASASRSSLPACEPSLVVVTWSLASRVLGPLPPSPSCVGKGLGGREGVGLVGA